MKSINVCFANPMIIPAIWKNLLALANLPTTARKADNTKVTDPVAYCDDRREIALKQGQLTAFAILCSGQTNYWLEWELWDGPDIVYSSEADGPDFEISDKMSIKSVDGTISVEFGVHLV